MSESAIALVSIQNTVSGGYYRDISKGKHSTLFYNMKLNQLQDNGSEIYLDLGINNSYVQEEWGTYPYQAYYSFVYGDGFDSEPQYRSKVQFGRIFLSEAFCADIFDGAHLNHYISSTRWVTIFAGGLHIPEEMKTDFDNTLYGAIISNKFSNGSIVKAGPLYEDGLTNGRTLGHVMFMAPFETIPWSPTVLVKEQYDFDSSKNDQFLAEVDLVKEQVGVDLFFSDIVPSNTLLRKRRAIYEIVAISKQKNIGATVDLRGDIDVALSGSLASFDSLAKNSERGYELELATGYYTRNLSVKPYVMYTDSFGGTVWDFGVENSYKLSDIIDIILNGSVAKIEKINGIEGWALHARSGIDYRLERYWKTLVALEAERNYRFDVDARAVVYLTHYYY